MLVACRLAGLSALILDYAVKVARAQFGPTLSTLAALGASWAAFGARLSGSAQGRPRPAGGRLARGTRAGDRRGSVQGSAAECG